MPNHSSEVTVMIEAPGRGIIVNDAIDARHIPDQSWVDGRNIRFFANATKARKSDSHILLDTTEEAIRQVIQYFFLDGAQELVRIGLTKVWRGTGVGLTDITGAPLTADVEDIETYTQYEDKLFFTDRKDPPQKWAGSGNVVAAGVRHPDFRAQHVVSFQSHLFYGDIFEDGGEFPWRLVYSATGTPEIFTGATSGDIDLVTTPGKLTALAVHEDALVAFKRGAIHQVQFVGLPLNFIQRVVTADDGALSARSVIKIGPFLYYRGRFNFYRMGSYPEQIGDPINNLWETVIDRTREGLVFAYHRAAFDEIIWRAPTVDADEPDLDFVYNYRDETWSIRDCDAGTSYARVRLAGFSDTWDGGEAGSWDAGQNISWDDPVLSLGEDTELFSKVNGEIRKYLGINSLASEPCLAYLESKIFQIDALQPTRIIRIPLIATGTGAIRVKLRAWDDERQPAPPYVDVGTYSLGPGNRKPWVDVRAWGRLAQIRFENASLEDDFEIEAYGLKTLPSGGER